MDGGKWMNTTNIYLNFGSLLELAPETGSEGTWKWSGCGTEGSSRIQSIYPSGPCSAVVRFTNNCGETSSRTFGINACEPALVTPYIQKLGGVWQSVTSMAVDSGTWLMVNPLAISKGTWTWSGCGINTTSSAVSFHADTSCSLKCRIHQ